MRASDVSEASRSHTDQVNLECMVSLVRVEQTSAKFNTKEMVLTCMLHYSWIDEKRAIILKRFAISGEIDLKATIYVRGGREQRLMRELVQIVSS